VTAQATAPRAVASEREMRCAAVTTEGTAPPKPELMITTLRFWLTTGTPAAAAGTAD
jgi:hypothetical protein